MAHTTYQLLHVCVRETERERSSVYFIHPSQGNSANDKGSLILKTCKKNIKRQARERPCICVSMPRVCNFSFGVCVCFVVVVF